VIGKMPRGRNWAVIYGSTLTQETPMPITTHEGLHEIIERDDLAQAILHESHGEPIAQFFAYNHLPPQLQEISQPFARLAIEVIRNIPRNPERSVALRKLLEGKDAAVRARLFI
jgi:hypothetical protein